MTDKEYLKNLRIPTEENPLRILVSACMTGVLCGVDGSANGVYPTVLKLIPYKNVKISKFCPEDHSFGTPRETPDIQGGTGYDVLDGKAKVFSETGQDMTEGMIKGAYKMLEIAQKDQIELAVMMDTSAACGSQVIYNGSRFQENKIYQIGMGVSAALLARNGFKVISQRDYAALEILYSKIDPSHQINPDAIDHDQHPWYKQYFNN